MNKLGHFFAGLVVGILCMVAGSMLVAGVTGPAVVLMMVAAVIVLAVVTVDD